MSWAQLLAIQQEARQEHVRVAGLPPDACPFCGALLELGPRGERACPTGDYRWLG